MPVRLVIYILEEPVVLLSKMRFRRDNSLIFRPLRNNRRPTLMRNYTIGNKQFQFQAVQPCPPAAPPLVSVITTVAMDRIFEMKQMQKPLLNCSKPSITLIYLPPNQNFTCDNCSARPLSNSRLLQHVLRDRWRIFFTCAQHRNWRYALYRQRAFIINPNHINREASYLSHHLWRSLWSKANSIA